jgi:hypothetical protein
MLNATGTDNTHFVPLCNSEPDSGSGPEYGIGATCPNWIVPLILKVEVGVLKHWYELAIQWSGFPGVD